MLKNKFFKRNKSVMKKADDANIENNDSSNHEISEIDDKDIESQALRKILNQLNAEIENQSNEIQKKMKKTQNQANKNK